MNGNEDTDDRCIVAPARRNCWKIICWSCKGNSLRDYRKENEEDKGVISSKSQSPSCVHSFSVLEIIGLLIAKRP